MLGRKAEVRERRALGGNDGFVGYDAVDVDAGGDDQLRVNCSGFSDGVHFGDGDAGSRGHDGVPATLRALIRQVAQGIGASCSNEGEIGA